MSKTSNLVQPSTGPTIYPPMKLPPVTTIPTAQDPHSYNRPGSAPAIPANSGPAVRAPQVK
jgi:hypothetical protein